MDAVGYYYTKSENIELVVTRGQARCYPWHMHTRHWIIGVIEHGAVCLTTRDARRWLCQGQYFCIPPHEPHSLNVEPESSLFVTCFDQQGASLLESSSESLFRHIPGLRTKEIRGVAESIATCSPLDFSGSRDNGSLASTRSPSESAVREITRQLLADPADSFDIEQMAAHAGYSPWHFLRSFRKVTGMTPHSFQLLCRLRLLRALLRADTTAVEAAVSAGFADQSHMHKVFKHHHGMTPNEFKRASVRLEL